MAGTKNWREVRGQRSLNNKRVEIYDRLMDAEIQLTELCARRGMSEDEVAQAIHGPQAQGTESERDDDVYLSTLSRYVAALGGHIEVQAVFPDQTLTVLRDDQPPSSGLD